MRGIDAATLVHHRWDKVLLKQLKSINPGRHMHTEGLKVAVFHAVYTEYQRERDVMEKEFGTAGQPPTNSKVHASIGSLLEPGYHMKVDAQAHATLLRLFEQLKHTVDQVVVKMRQNGQLTALKRLFLRMSRLEASGIVTPSQREDSREEYKALFAQLKNL
jgi:hypothetical protein